MTRSISLGIAAALSLAVGVVVLDIWHGAVIKNDQARITNVEKNRIWPVKGFITMEPCANSACLAV
jgi:hypothetical protein